MRPRRLLPALGSLVILSGLIPIAAAPVLAAPTELFVSEYIEGTSNNKAIEVFNGTGVSVDLAAGGYNIQMAFNGNAVPSLTISLTGTISNGDVYVLAHQLANATVQAQADQTNGAGWFNGDDAIILRKGSAILDVIGQVGFDPGTEWGSGLTSTADNTLRRKPAIQAGDSNGADVFDPSVQWDGFATDTFDGLGAHSLVTDAAPSVTSTIPTSGASNFPLDGNVSITFSEPVDATAASFDITCTASGTHSAALDGGPTTFVLDPDANFVDDETCTVTVSAAEVTDQDTDDPPNAMAADHVFSFSPGTDCGETATEISAIQGSGPNAAITGAVVVEGVVIADHEFAGSPPAPATLRGFYLQDADGGDDLDETSDGIFVFNGNNDSASNGQLVRVTGSATEFQNQTQINASSIEACGTGSVATTDVELPFATGDEPERYEGMLVRLPQALVVNEHFQLGRFGQVTVGSERHFSPTLVEEPGPAALAEIARQRLDSLIIDDNSQSQNPDPIEFGRFGNPLSASNTLRTGDSVTGVVGVMTYTWAGNAASGNAYRVRPVGAIGGGAPSFQATNPRPANPAPIDGELRVAAMNVLNYFTTLDPRGTGPFTCGPNANLECRGANDAQEFARQQAKIVEAITGLDADIVGLNELENNASASIESLVDAVNGVDGAGTWAYIDTGTIGTDAIKIGIIYKPAAVTPVGAHAILTSAVDPRFIDTRSRPALAQTFDQLGGGRFTMVVNHLKSKGSGCGAGDDATDGSGNCNGTRTAAAEALVDWIATDPTGSGDRDVLVIGDLNSYAKEAPIDVFIREGYTNLVEQFLGDEAYSFVFDASAGYLDHALASPTLSAQVAGLTEWHINADEPSILDYNTDFKSADQIEDLYTPDQYRSADHDPLLVGLDLLDYEFDGFQAPVDNPPALNVMKAGAGVPVKFELSGDLGLDVIFGTPTANQINCSSGAGGDTVETTVPGNSGLQYDPLTNTYTYVWKTQRQWANQCRVFEITFEDGTYRRALFSFTR
jgi:predicted extracellular nuclease